MKACTFFGHREVFENIVPQLRSLIIDLIETKQVNRFYVGNHGMFDYLVCRVLSDVKLEYENIDCFVVLAYMPIRSTLPSFGDTETVFPEELENTPPKFAIPKRNKWMIDKSQYVITYVKYNTAGAAKSKELAERSGKIVINIADDNH